MKKQKLRAIFKSNRQELTDEYIIKKSNDIMINLFDFLMANDFKNIHVFLSSKQMKEVQTDILIQLLWQNGIEVYSSISDFNNSSMKHIKYMPNTKLVISPYNIPEPVGEEWVDEKLFDAVITPLICFDSNGYRVGYGKGFYDRFFERCKSDVAKIGVSFFDAVAEISDTDQFDFPLDYVFTPDKMYAF